MKWFLIVLIYAGGQLDDYKIFFGDDKAECLTAKGKVMASATAAGREVWADCFEITYKPPAKEIPKDKKSEVNS